MSVKDRLAQFNKTGSGLPGPVISPQQQQQHNHPVSIQQQSSNSSIGSKNFNVGNRNQNNLENEIKGLLSSTMALSTQSTPNKLARVTNASPSVKEERSSHENESAPKLSSSMNEAHLSRPIITSPDRKRPSKQKIQIPADHILTKADIEAVEAIDSRSKMRSALNVANANETKSEIPPWKRQDNDTYRSNNNNNNTSPVTSSYNSGGSSVKPFGSSSNVSNTVNAFRSNSTFSSGTSFKGMSSIAASSPASTNTFTNTNTNANANANNQPSYVSPSISTTENSSQSNANSDKATIERLEKMVTEQEKRIKMLEEELQAMRNEMKKHGVSHDRINPFEIDKTSSSKVHDDHPKSAFALSPSSPKKSIVSSTASFVSPISPVSKFQPMTPSPVSSQSSPPSDIPLYSQGKEAQIKLASIAALRDKFNKQGRSDDEILKPSSMSTPSQHSFRGNEKWFDQKKQNEKKTFNEDTLPTQVALNAPKSDNSLTSIKESLSPQNNPNASTQRDESRVDVAAINNNKEDDGFELLEKEQEVLNDKKVINTKNKDDENDHESDDGWSL